MDYTALNDLFFSIQVDCEQTREIHNVIDLYECEREQRIFKSYAQKFFLKKNVQSDLKKWNQPIDEGGFKISEDFLILRQFVDYNIRLGYWREINKEEITVSIKIGIPGRKSEELENFMREWSRRILGKPLLILDVPNGESIQVSPFETSFVWKIKENNPIHFSYRTQFLSDQFENFLGHQTYLLFVLTSGTRIVGRFAFKFFVCKKDLRTVVMKRFVNPMVRPLKDNVVRGLHLYDGEQKSKFEISQERGFLLRKTRARYGLFQSKIVPKSLSDLKIYYAKNGDLIFFLDPNRRNFLRLYRKNFFDPTTSVVIRIEVSFDIGVGDDALNSLKRPIFSVKFPGGGFFSEGMLECEATKNAVIFVCQYPKYLDPKEAFLLDMEFDKEVFKKLNLDSPFGKLNVCYYKEDESLPIDQHYAWIMLDKTIRLDSPEVRELDAQIQKWNPNQASTIPIPEMGGIFNTLSCYRIYAIFFLKITELHVAVPVYIYRKDSKGFLEALIATYNNLFCKKIGRILSFTINNLEIYSDQTKSFLPFTIPNQSFLEFSCTEDLTSEIVLVDTEITKYNGYKVDISVDHGDFKKIIPQGRRIIFSGSNHK